MCVAAISSIYDLDRELKFVLAGVFVTTPKELFILLGGVPENYDEDSRQMMELHLKTFGYSERTYLPYSWSTPKTSWVRSVSWPEDKVWVDGDLNKIMDHLEAACV